MDKNKSEHYILDGDETMDIATGVAMKIDSLYIFTNR